MYLLKALEDTIWFFSIGLLISTILYEFYVVFSPIHQTAGIASIIIVGLLIINDVHPRLKNGALL